MPVDAIVKRYVDAELQRMRAEIERALRTTSGGAWATSPEDSGAAAGVALTEDGGAAGGITGEDSGTTLGGGGDDVGYSPIYLQVASNGAIAYVFDGGLLLPETTSAAYISSNGIGWEDSGGTVREFIQGYFSGNHYLTLGSNPDAQDQAIVFCQAGAGGAAGNSSVQASAVDQTTAVSQTVVILNSTKGSDFLFRGRGGRSSPWFVDSGNPSLTIPLNTNGVTQAITFNAPFTNAPNVSTSCDPSGSIICHVAQSVTNTGFIARVFWSDGSATHAAKTVPFYWVAEGN